MTHTTANPFSPYGTPKPRRRRAPKALFVLLPIALFLFMFFGLSYLTSADPKPEVQPGIGQANIGGRDVVLVPYERTATRGMWQVLTQDMFQVRLAAADLATGDILWDTQLSDELVWEATVLAAGERLAYLATDSGLAIVNLADGKILASGDGVRGLGTAYAETRAAYAYDAENRRVMAMNGTGAVLAIPLDSEAATTIDPAAAAPWTETLSATDRAPSPSPVTALEGVAGADTLVLEGKPAAGLFRHGPDGKSTQIGSGRFPSARLVVDGDKVTGGFALISHNRSVNDSASVLTAISLSTGAATGSVDTGSTPERVLALADGSTVITTSGGVAVLGADGSLRTLPIGVMDFFGSTT